MSADSDLICSPVPPPPAPDAPDASDERSRKTEIMKSVEGEKSMVKKVIVGLLVVALLAGVAFAILKDRLSGNGASASAETAVRTEGSAETVATATGTDAAPAQCQGDVTDPQVRWYCQDFLPFATKAAADHDRLDRLEAQLKDAKDSGSSGVPTALWVLLIAIGLLSVYNTVQIVQAKKPDQPEEKGTPGP